MPIVYKMKDKTDKFTIKKDNIPNLPMRMIGVGSSGSGKTSVIGNLLLRDDFYKNDFDPENIFIFTGSKGDAKIKIIKDQLDIPNENIIVGFNEDVVKTIYDMVVDEFNDHIKNNTKPPHVLFMFDDLGYTNRLSVGRKKDCVMSLLYSNGRKYLISTLTLVQKHSQNATVIRNNTSCGLFWNCNNRELELIETDFNFLKGKGNKQRFHDMFRKLTENNKHDFMVVDLSKKDIYRDKNFEPICTCMDGTNKCGNKII
jgi:hypothetical protein